MRGMATLHHGKQELLVVRDKVGLLCSDNIVLHTLAGLIRFEMLGIAAKYDIKSIYFFNSNS